MNPHEDHEYRCMLLAALLHDIGKFAQRTGRHAGRSHPELSAWFVSEFLGHRWKDVEQAVAYHHLPAAGSAPNPSLALTLVLADWMSSGERQELPEGETGEPADDALISVFSQLRPPVAATRYPLRELAADGVLRPRPGVTAGSGDYVALWDSFVAECRGIDRDDFRLLVDQLLALLEKYTLFVPSASWKSESDISLYHHLKSTAAIAACLYRNEPKLSTETINDLLEAFRVKRADPTQIAWLVGGDLSGIQDFLYGIAAKGALKSLRGRSLYLQLLPEAVLSGLLDALRLTRANIIYCGGGHFYLLAPATEETEAAIQQRARQCDEALLRAHGGRLSLALATQPLTVSDFRHERFGIAWDSLHQRLAREKKRRFSALLTADRVTDILGPHGVGGEPEACEACGDELEHGREGKCAFCESLEELARKLTKATVMVEASAGTGEPATKPHAWHEVLAALGRGYWFETGSGNAGSKWLLNQTDFVSGGNSGFRFLAKHVPQVNGATAELAQIAENSDGIQKWGVLRADVDNLGDVFKNGLGDNRSISRLSMLSHLLSYFFSARVQAIAGEDGFKDRIYLAYSGGDDMFVIGAWSALPGFAERIRNDFGEFTSARMTLSAGIAVAPSLKFPVYEAADLAGEAESAAKRAPDKDSICFLGTTAGWKELDAALRVKNRLVALVEGGLPRAILGTLRSIWQQQQEAKDGRIPMFPIWRLLYAFKRLKARSKDELTSGIDELEHEVVVGNGLHPQLDLIVRWAELETGRKDAE